MVYSSLLEDCLAILLDENVRNTCEQERAVEAVASARKKVADDVVAGRRYAPDMVVGMLNRDYGVIICSES